MTKEDDVMIVNRIRELPEKLISEITMQLRWHYYGWLKSTMT